MPSLNATIPLSLYIHLPWCIKKCPYCDFNSHTHNGELPEKNYIDALIRDLDAELPFICGRRLSSIFIGGGTPSLFSGSAIGALLQAVNTRLPFSNNLEITLEANPGTAEQQRFRDYRQAGVNRLSIGVQSFNEAHLKKLGRIHDSAAAKKAIEKAANAGFDNLNIDLMFGLPEQSLKEALVDLQVALSFSPQHLSWYQLTIEPNTLFYAKPPTLPIDDLLWEMQEAGIASLQKNNLHPYEISAYSVKNRQCLHNRNYWEFGDYVGIGAGAHGKITLTDKQHILRRVKVKNPKDYLHPEKPFVATSAIILPNELPFEFMLNALRLTDGVPLQLFCERTGLTLAVIAPLLTAAIQKNFIEDNNQYLKTTPLGRRFLNNAVELFL